MSKINFAKEFKKICNENKIKTALIIKDSIRPQEITYYQLNQYVNEYCYLLMKYGCKENDVIITLLPNSFEQIITFLSSALSNLSIAPLPCSTTESKINQLISFTKAKLLITTSLVDIEIIDKIKVLNPKLKIVFLESLLEKELTYEENNLNYISNNSRLIISTSGTSGKPKYLVHKIETLWDSAKNFSKIHNIENSMYRFWNFLPMSYLGGLFNLLLIPISCKGSILIDESFSGSTLLSFWENFKRYKIDAMWIVPTIARSLIKFRKRVNSDLIKEISKLCKIAFIGTAPFSPLHKKEFLELFDIKLLENYGLTETTFISTDIQSMEESRWLSGVGKVIEDISVKLEDKNSKGGNILVKTRFLFEGYIQNKDIISKPIFDCGNYFDTKDIGKIDENLILKITGRDKEIIKKGGFLVNLKEIELIVLRGENISEAAAIRISHEFYGESYNLYVVLNDNQSTPTIESENEIINFVHNSLDKFQWPDKIKFLPSIPKSGSGKILKNLITEI